MENWLPVVGYEGVYEISDRGRFKRIKYGRGVVAVNKPRLGTLTADGYRHTVLSRLNKKKSILIHRIVLAAFVGPCPDGKETNHKDGVKDNNWLGNLEYMTPKENTRHAIDVLGIKIGSGSYCGEQHPYTRLTNQQVLDIRAKYAAGGVTLARLGKQYGYTEAGIWKIVRRKSWRHI